MAKSTSADDLLKRRPRSNNTRRASFRRIRGIRLTSDSPETPRFVERSVCLRLQNALVADRILPGPPRPTTEINRTFLADKRAKIVSGEKFQAAIPAGRKNANGPLTRVTGYVHTGVAPLKALASNKKHGLTFYSNLCASLSLSLSLSHRFIGPSLFLFSAASVRGHQRERCRAIGLQFICTRSLPYVCSCIFDAPTAFQN